MKNRLVVLFLLVLCSCAYKYPRGFVKREMNASNLIDPKLSNNQLRTDGFYYREEYFKYERAGVEKVDTFYNKMIFYPDGHFIYDFYLRRDGEYLTSSLEKSVQTLSNLESDSALYRMFRRGYWGYFKLHGDTIKTKYADKPIEGKWSSTWQLYKQEYLLINDSTLKWLSIEPIHRTSEFDKVRLQKYYEESGPLTAHFIPVKNMPKPNPWFNKELWYEDF